MSAIAQIAVRHFGKAVVRTLDKRGVRIIGITASPDMRSAMPYANAETGYTVDDNGTGRVLTHAEVRGLAS